MDESSQVHATPPLRPVPNGVNVTEPMKMQWNKEERVRLLEIESQFSSSWPDTVLRQQ
jgi:hypothetical protein